MVLEYRVVITWKIDLITSRVYKFLKLEYLKKIHPQ